MTQDIESMDNLSSTPPEDRINPVARSNRENGSQRFARTLKEKMEDEQKKKARKDDTLIISDDHHAEKQPDQSDDKHDNEKDSIEEKTDRTEIREEDAPATAGHIDLKV